jgi:hypothetical protein
LVFPLVPNVFPSCSQKIPQIPKLFPKTFTMSPQNYPIWFAQSSTLTFINWKKVSHRVPSFVYFVPRVQWGASIGECSIFQKNWWWVNQYDSFKKQKKKQTYEHTHELINMNHTNIPNYHIMWTPD